MFEFSPGNHKESHEATFAAGFGGIADAASTPVRGATTVETR
jgi:hypothetical protein